MKFSDETLMAYADGELDAATRAEIEAAAADDPRIARAIERHCQLRQLLQRKFDPILDEPVPDRLRDALGSAQDQGRDAPAQELRQGPAAATPVSPRRWPLPVWAAMAATLVLGAFIGLMVRDSAPALFETHDDRLVAAGELSRALSQTLARDVRPDSPVRPGISFRTLDGEYCRTFAVGASAGLACREAEYWRIDLLEKLPAAEVGIERYRLAGAELPRALRDTVDTRIDGDPLDAAGEAAARERGWR
jgi:hypothetical protein